MWQDSEATTPTVVNVPFVDASNPSRPTSSGDEKGTKETHGSEAAASAKGTTASDTKKDKDDVGTGVAVHNVNEPFSPSVVDVPFIDVHADAAASAKGTTASDTKKPKDDVGTGVAVHNVNEPYSPSVVDVPFIDVHSAATTSTTSQAAEAAAAAEDKPAYVKIVAPENIPATVPAAASKSVGSSSSASKAAMATGKPLMTSSKRDIYISTKSGSSSSSSKSGKSSKTTTEGTSTKASELEDKAARMEEKLAEMEAAVEKYQAKVDKVEAQADKYSAEKDVDADVGDIFDPVEVDFSYGSIENNDFRDPVVGEKVVVVTQLVNGIGKRAGNWKERFEGSFVPAVAKAIGVSKSGVAVTNVNRVNIKGSHGQWDLQVTSHAQQQPACTHRHFSLTVRR